MGVGKPVLAVVSGGGPVSGQVPDRAQDVQSVQEVQTARGGQDTQAYRLCAQPQLVEVFAAPCDLGAVGFALAQVPAGKPVLWVQDRMCGLETGRPHGHALGRFGGDPDKLILACARNAADVLAAMEEGLKCSALGAIIGEIWGDPRALDFTATKRLALRAERSGVATFLIRFGGSETLSAARQRWRIGSAASAPHPHDPRAPGAPRWCVELFRARDARPGRWEAGYDIAAHRLDLTAALPDPALAPAQPRRDRAG